MSGDRAEAVRPAARIRLRAWTVALAAVALGCGYFFVRQFFKDGIWRFDLTLVNKSLGVAALLLLALSMLLTGPVLFLAPRLEKAGSPQALRAGRILARLLAHGAVEHVILPVARPPRPSAGPGPATPKPPAGPPWSSSRHGRHLERAGPEADREPGLAEGPSLRGVCRAVLGRGPRGLPQEAPAGRNISGPSIRSCLRSASSSSSPSWPCLLRLAVGFRRAPEEVRPTSASPGP